MTLKFIGIGSCDRCRSARRWLDEQGLSYEQRDVRESPPTVNEANAWIKGSGDADLLNRRSTTWRNLPEARRPGKDEAPPPELLVEFPLLIRRPLWVRGDDVRCGFDDDVRAWLQA